MVWVHGGGFTSGSGGMYDAHRLAVQGDVVVVTVNYRLGVFGFFGHPELGRDSGAFGLEDQVAALRWVRRNAAAFGGDPRNVTLFGESAGGLSTCGLLTSPVTAGLFQRAIVQSGPCTITSPVGGVAASPWPDRSAVEQQGGRLATARGCVDVTCLRRVPADELMAEPLAPVFSWPAFDTDVLPESPATAVVAGHVHRVPVLAGTNRDEGSLFAALEPNQPITEQAYQQSLRAAFADKADRVAARYPSSAYGTPGTAWAAVQSDRVWACSALTTDRALAARTRLYAYEFADRNAPRIIPFPPGIEPGAYHAAELTYLFDLAGFDPKFTPEQQRLSDRMIRAWTRFADTGDPQWRQFPTVLSLAPEAVKPVDLAAEHQCAFWDTLA
jgi:para-nitrobenzyl esterase